MKARQRRFDELGALVLVVTFDDLEAAGYYRSALELPYPVASDPTREAYRDYGLARGSTFQVWHPRTLWHYAKLVLGKGMKLQHPTGDADLSQLGGDFVIDGAGLIRFAHRSLRPDDRPAVDDLLEALERAGRMS